MSKIILVLSGLIFVIFLAFCNENSPNIPINKNTDTVLIDKSRSFECDTFQLVKYEKVYINNSKKLNEIRNNFNFDDDSSDAHRSITTLNRKEFRFIRVGDSVIVPEYVFADMKYYSIFPECYPEARSINKLILVSNKYQCYACYEYGKLVRFAAANTGKERTQTYPGRYSLVWRQRVRHSSLDSSWVMPYTWNFHAQAGNAFHQFAMPGRPVSHSCVRQFMRDAKWLFSWGEGSKMDENRRWIPMSGTNVIILDVFDFSRKKYGAWADLKSNKDVKIQLPAKPLEYEEALIPICQIPKDSRASLVNRSRFESAEDTLRSRGVIREGVVLTETRNFNREKRLRAARRKKQKELNEQKSKLAPVVMPQTLFK